MPLKTWGSQCKGVFGDTGDGRNNCACTRLADGVAFLYSNEPSADACSAMCEGYVYCRDSTNSAPTATPIITGTAAMGLTLTGSYTYADAESNPEGTTTFKWYTWTDNTCAGKTAITGATSKTYTIQAADVNKFLCFGVTPVATAGTLTGTEVIATTTGAVPANSAPTATPSITGTASVGQTLTGSYTYADAEGDPEGTTTFKWYTATDAACSSGKSAIAGATAKTYTIQAADVNKFLCFGVTPVATAGTLTGTEVIATTTGAVPANSAPTATGVSITGTAAAGQTLTGSYTYADAESDPQGVSTFRWYAGTDANCTGKTAITGATARTYTLTANEKGKFVCFGVTPVATAGTLTGTEAIATTTAADTPLYASSPGAGVIPAMTAAAPANATTPLTVSNTGTAALNITGITIGGTDAGKFSVSPNTFPVSVAAAGNNPFTITCNGSVKGSFSATMAVAHNAAGTPANYTLSCTVTTAPLYTSSPAPNGTLSMTSCTPTDAATTLTVTNTGTDVLNITGITLGGTNKDRFSVSPTATADKPLTVAVTRNQVFTITGKGSTVGTFTGTSEITHNAAGSPAKYTLSSVISDCYVPTYYDPGPSTPYVPPVNEPPTADRVYASTEVNKPIAVRLTGNDPDGGVLVNLLNALGYTVLTQPQHGKLSGAAPYLTYTPDAGFVGTDSFTFKASDGKADSAVSTVSLIVHQNSHAYVSDDYAMTFFSAEYQGVKYGFTMNYGSLVFRGVVKDVFRVYQNQTIHTSNIMIIIRVSCRKPESEEFRENG